MDRASNSFHQHGLRNSFDSKTNSSFSNRSISMSPESRSHDITKKYGIISYGKESPQIKKRSVSRSRHDHHYSIPEAPDLYSSFVPEIEKAQTNLSNKRQTIKELHKDWTVNEMLFPGQNVAKLCNAQNPNRRDLNFKEILIDAGFKENCPVIMISGLNLFQYSELLIGTVRAAMKTDAVIIDSGLRNGFEYSCLRKKVKLIGICPEDQIMYPTKVNSGNPQNELSAGHSHLFVLGHKNDNLKWNDIALFKILLADKIRKGIGGNNSFQCRGLCILAGEIEDCMKDAERAVHGGWTVLAIEATPIGQEISLILKGKKGNRSLTYLEDAILRGKVFIFPENGNEEDLAMIVHLHLTVTLLTSYWDPERK